MSRLRVLIVDDDKDNRESMRLLVQIWGYETCSADDFTSALDASKQFRPHAVLLDIGLPERSGLELAPLLREQGGKDLLLVAVTGFGRDADKADSRAAGFDVHLTKPVDPVELHLLLKRLS